MIISHHAYIAHIVWQQLWVLICWQQARICRPRSPAPLGVKGYPRVTLRSAARRMLYKLKLMKWVIIGSIRPSETYINEIWLKIHWFPFKKITLKMSWQIEAWWCTCWSVKCAISVSDNGLLPVRHQAINWTCGDSVTITPSGTSTHWKCNTRLFLWNVACKMSIILFSPMIYKFHSCLLSTNVMTCTLSLSLDRSVNWTFRNKVWWIWYW